MSKLISKFILNNVGKTNVGFTVYTPLPDGAELMAKHKIRKLKNSGNIYVNLKPNTSVDLLELTGMTVKELMDNPEVRELVNTKTDRVFAIIEGDGIDLKEDPEEVPEEPVKEGAKAPQKKPSKKSKKKSKEDVAPPSPSIAPPTPTIDSVEK